MKESLLDELYKEKAIGPLEYFFAQTNVPKDLKKHPSIELVSSFLMRASLEGHISLNLKDLSFILSMLDGAEEKKILWEKAIETYLEEFCALWEDYSAALTPFFCRIQDHLYLPKNWTVEGIFIEEVKRLLSSQPMISVNEIENSHLNIEQKQAVSNALKFPFSIITGGPGTGKTFTAAAIVNQFLKRAQSTTDKPLHIILTAPTGKAAAHLEKSILSKIEDHTKLKPICGTIHSLLQMHQWGDNAEGSVIDADLIIVDECSMIDLNVFSRLLSAIRNKEGSIILMGDKDQLPPVEAGSIFAELIHYAQYSNALPYVELKQGMRTSRKDLITLAACINKGTFSFGDDLASENIKKVSLGLSQDRPQFFYDQLFSYLRPHFDTISLNPMDILEKFDNFRVLNCVRKGPFGVDILNEYLVKKFAQLYLPRGFFVAPILITQNNPKLALYNGDTGIAVYKEVKGGSFNWRKGESFFFDKNKELQVVPIGAIPRFEFGYCLSVHKSQGSEYGKVLILCPVGTEAFGKEILYTAVTRAKDKVEIDFHESLKGVIFKDTSRRITGFLNRVELKPS